MLLDHEIAAAFIEKQNPPQEVMSPRAFGGFNFVEQPKDEDAFLKALASKELKADADKMRIDVSGMSGEDLRAYVQRLYATPKDILKALAASLAH